MGGGVWVVAWVVARVVAHLVEVVGGLEEGHQVVVLEVLVGSEEGVVVAWVACWVVAEVWGEEVAYLGAMQEWGEQLGAGVGVEEVLVVGGGAGVGA